MGPLKAIASCYLNMFNFVGRTRRAEYWWFALFMFLAYAVVQVATVIYVLRNPWLLDSLNSPAAMQALLLQNSSVNDWGAYALVGKIVFLWLQHLSVTIRRLHDTNRSGWYIFVPFLTTIAGIVGGTFIFMVTLGQGAAIAMFAMLVVPLVVNIWFFVIMCLPGTHGNNDYGPDPIPNRKRKPPAHPAFAPRLPPNEQAEIAALRQSEIKDYYRKHVLPGIQRT